MEDIKWEELWGRRFGSSIGFRGAGGVVAESFGARDADLPPHSTPYRAHLPWPAWWNWHSKRPFTFSRKIRRPPPSDLQGQTRRASSFLENSWVKSSPVWKSKRRGRSLCCALLAHNYATQCSTYLRLTLHGMILCWIDPAHSDIL